MEVVAAAANLPAVVVPLPFSANVVFGMEGTTVTECPEHVQHRARTGTTDRLAGKFVFVTLAGIPRNLFTMQEIAEEWNRRAKPSLVEFMICSETHSDPAIPANDEHFHYYGQSEESYESMDWSKWSIWKDGKRYFPQVLQAGYTMEDKHFMCKYIRKAGKVWQNMIEDPCMYKPLGSIFDKLKDVSTVAEGMALLRDLAPRDYFLNGSRIRTMLTAMVTERAVVKTFPLESFKEEYQFDMKTLKPPGARPKCLVLCGPSNCGKTELAMALGGARPYLACEIDDFKTLPTDATAVVCDDMNFGPRGADLTPEQTIHLLDITRRRSIKCRNKNGVIPAGMMRIFTTNLSMDHEILSIFPRGVGADQNEAIKDRFFVLKVTEKAF